MEIVKREDVEQFLSEFHQKLKITDAIRYNLFNIFSIYNFHVKVF